MVAISPLLWFLCVAVFWLSLVLLVWLAIRFFTRLAVSAAVGFRHLLALPVYRVMFWVLTILLFAANTASYVVAAYTFIRYYVVPAFRLVFARRPASDRVWYS